MFKTMITENDLKMQFRKATGTDAERFRSEYRIWVEQSYLELLNKNEEDKKAVEELFVDKDGE